ncbi:unnamed protein product [Toxocara canis]|uniref:ZP domain-containing protein n=1 Tax=Toxocara canis TaxID=6265 RepID=A0A183TYW9_TOXCA|nr:unnamed protein product [Toxocara canis]
MYEDVILECHLLCSISFCGGMISRYSNAQYNVKMFDNGSALVDAQSSDIRRSVWSNELCRDVATKVRLTFLTDGRNVTNVTFEFGYDTVTRENFTTIHYQIEVFFEDSSSADRVTPPDTSSSDGNSQGYDLLDPILTSDGYFKLPFRHHCNDSGTVQIRFGVDITTGCKMIVSECASLRWQIKQLFTSFEYLNISSSPSLRSSQANVFIDSEPPTTRSLSVNCDLTTSVTVEIGFARQGDQLNFKRRIISVAYRYAQAQPYSLNEYPQNTIPIVFFVHFVDISTPATNVFARMPTVNLALPSDFFYPFLTSSAQQHFVKFCLIYATALAVLLLARTIFEYRT